MHQNAELLRKNRPKPLKQTSWKSNEIWPPWKSNSRPFNQGRINILTNYTLCHFMYNIKVAFSQKNGGFFRAQKICQKTILNYYIQYMAMKKSPCLNWLTSGAFFAYSERFTYIFICLTAIENSSLWFTYLYNRDLLYIDENCCFKKWTNDFKVVLKCPILYINLDITIQLAYIVNNHLELYNGLDF